MLRFTEAQLLARISSGVRSAPDSYVAAQGSPGVFSSEASAGKDSATQGRDHEAARGNEVPFVMLPYPVSANRYWRTFRGRQVISAEAKQYKQAVMMAWADARAKYHYQIDVSVDIVLHPKLTKKGTSNKTLMDLDNCIKVTLDALSGSAYLDDNQVHKLLVFIGDPVKDGGLSVKVTEI